MRKLLTLLVVFGTISVAYADTQLDFDKTKTECMKTTKAVKLNDGMKKAQITKSCTVNARKESDPVDRVRFNDDLSHKEVFCAFDNNGRIKQDSCFRVN